MKKRTLLLMLLAFILLAGSTSCNKPEYNPKKKISKIYTSNLVYEMDDNFDIDPSIKPTVSEKALNQVWTWDKNLLKQIDYMEEGSVANSLKMGYDSKKLLTTLTSVYEDYSLTAKVSYDKKHWNRIEFFNTSTIPYMTYEVTKREKDKIAQLTLTFNWGDDDKKMKRSLDASNKVFQLFGAQNLSPIFTKLANKSINGSKDGESHIVDLIYSGDNVSEIRAEGNIIAYTYDTKKNPYYNCLATEELESPFALTTSLSKNNILTRYGIGENVEMSYKYDKSGFPTEMIIEIDPTNFFKGWNMSFTNHFYFEYK